MQTKRGLIVKTRLRFIDFLKSPNEDIKEKRDLFLHFAKKNMLLSPGRLANAFEITKTPINIPTLSFLSASYMNLLQDVNLVPHPGDADRMIPDAQSERQIKTFAMHVLLCACDEVLNETGALHPAFLKAFKIKHEYRSRNDFISGMASQIMMMITSSKNIRSEQEQIKNPDDAFKFKLHAIAHIINTSKKSIKNIDNVRKKYIELSAYIKNDTPEFYSIMLDNNFYLYKSFTDYFYNVILHPLTCTLAKLASKEIANACKNLQKEFIKLRTGDPINPEIIQDSLEKIKKIYKDSNELNKKFKVRSNFFFKEQMSQIEINAIQKSITVIESIRSNLALQPALEPTKRIL